jgi:hypothetical protein
MERDEIINTLVGYLDQQLKELRGYIGQEPSRSDFFKLFREAYERDYFEVSPSLKADSIREAIMTRWKTPDQEDKKLDLIKEWSTRWDEWRYAWDKHP